MQAEVLVLAHHVGFAHKAIVLRSGLPSNTGFVFPNRIYLMGDVSFTIKGGRDSMAKWNVERLFKGISRLISPSELVRGYVFVSADKGISEHFRSNDFELDYNGHIMSGRRLDSSGRVHIPKSFIAELAAPKKVLVKIESQWKLTISESR